jgi:hypothetical protein
MSVWSAVTRRLKRQSNAPYVPVPRVIPEGSWVELAKRKKEIRHELRARLYLYQEKLILCPVAGIAEVGEPTIVQADIASSDLGLLICDHLLQFRPQTPHLERARKASDWEAYQVSGAKSVRAFKENAWFVHVETKNTAILANAGPFNSLHGEITVQGTAGFGPHEEIGAVVMRALKAASVLRDGRIV